MPPMQSASRGIDRDVEGGLDLDTRCWSGLAYSAGSAAATRLRRPCRHRRDDALEVSVRAGIAVDRHVLGNIELQARDVAEQRHGVGTDIREIPSRGGRAVKVRVDRDLLLGEIRDQHVVAVVETVDMIEFDRLIAVADRVLVRERLQFQRSGSRRRERPLREPVELERSLLRGEDDPLIEVSIAIVGDDGRAFRHESAYATQMIEVAVGVNEIADRLIWEGLLDLVDHGEGALLIERPLDHRDEVLELDGDAVRIRAAR